MGLLYKESIGMEIYGEYKFKSSILKWNGTIEFLLEENKQYSLFANLNLEIENTVLPISLWMVEGQIFLKIYDNVLSIDTSNINEFFQIILNRFDVSLPVLDIKDQALTILKGIKVLESQVEINVFDLNALLSFFLDGENLNLGIQLEDMNCSVVVSPIEYSCV